MAAPYRGSLPAARCGLPAAYGPRAWQPYPKDADDRQERADAVDEDDIRAIGKRAERAAPMPPAPNARPKKRPEIVPTRPGTSSCANTTMAEKADASTTPMMTVRMRVQNRSA